MGKRGGQSFRYGSPKTQPFKQDGATDNDRAKLQFGGFTEWADPTRDRRQAEESYLAEGRRNGLRGNKLREFVEERLKKRDLPHRDKFKYK